MNALVIGSSLLLCFIGFSSVNGQSFRQQCYRDMMGCVKDKSKEQMKQQFGPCLEQGECVNPMDIKNAMKGLMKEECGIEIGEDEIKGHFVDFIKRAMKKARAESGGNFFLMMPKLRQKIQEKLGMICDRPNAAINCAQPILMQKMRSKFMALQRQGVDFGSMMNGGEPDYAQMIMMMKTLKQQEISACQREMPECADEFANEPSEAEIQQMVEQKKAEHAANQGQRDAQRQQMCSCVSNDISGSELEDALEMQLGAGGSLPSSFDGSEFLSEMSDELCANEAENDQPQPPPNQPRIGSFLSRIQGFLNRG